MSAPSTQGTATAVQLITQPEGGRTVKVRTTFTPGIVHEVGDAELLDLDRQGLIHSREGDEHWVDDEPTEVESGVITDAQNADPSTEDEDGEEPADAKAPDQSKAPKADAKSKGEGK